MSDEKQELSIGAIVRITYAGRSIKAEVISIGEKEVKCRWFDKNDILHEAIFPKGKAIIPIKESRILSELKK